MFDSHRCFLTVVFIALLVGTDQRSSGHDWSNWRGPTGQGRAEGSDYPIHWSRTENIRWKVTLPGTGASTPAVWDQRIFLTYGAAGKNVVMCLDRDGNQRWTTDVGTERSGKHKKATGSNSSPATDGRHVFVYFKSGDLAALDFHGQVRWEKNLQSLYGADTLWWDLGTSPVLTRDFVVVACVQSGPSYIIAFHKDSGELAWKVSRQFDAPREANQSYTTPCLASFGGREILVVLGADHVTGHEVLSGAQLWQVGGLNPSQNAFFRSIASPVFTGEFVVAPYARGETISAIRVDGSGDVTDTHVAWFREGIGADVPTPAVADGRVYVCGDKGTIFCLDVRTGNTVWAEQLEKSRVTFSSSPVVAGGHVYVTREDGTTFVLRQADRFELVATNRLDEPTVATPVFVDKTVLIRTLNHVYCVGDTTN